jgi:hypothetical protein
MRRVTSSLLLVVTLAITATTAWALGVAVGNRVELKATNPLGVPGAATAPSSGRTPSDGLTDWMRTAAPSCLTRSCGRAANREDQR